MYMSNAKFEETPDGGLSEGPHPRDGRIEALWQILKGVVAKKMCPSLDVLILYKKRMSRIQWLNVVCEHESVPSN